MSRSLRTRPGRLLAGLATATSAALLVGGLAATSADAAAPPPPKMLTLSKTTGINYTGDTVVVSGNGYSPDTLLYLTLCDLNDPHINMGGGCVQDPSQVPVNIDQVKTDASGAFSKAFSVSGTLRLTSTDVRNCMLTTVKCAVATSNVVDPTDMSSIGFSPAMTFAESIVKPGKVNLNQVGKRKVLVTWVGAVSGPAPVTRYVVQVQKKKHKTWTRWHRATTVSANQTWAIWKGRKDTTYKLRAKAMSTVGNATGKPAKIRL